MSGDTATVMRCPRCKSAGLPGPRRAQWSLFVWFHAPRGEFVDSYQCKECHLIFAPVLTASMAGSILTATE